MISTDDVLNFLLAMVGEQYVITPESDLATFNSYCTDWRGRYHGAALAVVKPGSTEEVAAIVKLCAEAHVAIVPQGGNTGLCGGATPVGNINGGEILINLTRLNKVRHVDPDNNTLTVEAGCTLQQVQQAAAEVGRLFPLSLASEGTATIGGNLSTNAGGVQVLRYGNTRDLTLGLEVVTADGEIWNGLRALRKDNTGYDLKHLFIGAEGTLGLITAAVLKLFPAPRSHQTAWLAVPGPEQAVSLLSLLRQQLGDRVTAFEIIGASALSLVLKNIPGSRNPLDDVYDWQVLIELSDPAEADLSNLLMQALGRAMEQGLLVDAVLAASEAQSHAIWQLRENISEAQRIEGVSIKHDVAVPVSSIPEFISRAGAALAELFPGVRIVCFGHIGDGNLHYNLSRAEGGDDNASFIRATPQVNEIVHDIVASLGGSISAEHGLGQLKRDEIQRYKSAHEIAMMRAIKAALDPQGLMNPGKLIGQ